MRCSIAGWGVVQCLAIPEPRPPAPGTRKGFFSYLASLFPLCILALGACFRIMASTTTLTLPVTGVNPQNQPFTVNATVAAQYDPPTAGSTAQATVIGFVGDPPQGAILDPTQLVVVTVAGPVTTTSSNPNPTPTSPPAQTVKKETNGGLVAGVAIGCLLAGALIGFVIALFLYRRRQQKQQPGGGNGTYIVSSSTAEPKGHHPPPGQVSAPKDSAINLDKFLLDTTPDQEIAGELHSLGSLIQQHVENNYHLYPINADPRQLALALKQLGLVEGSLSAEAVATLAVEPQTRHVALQHVISQVLFSSVDVGSRSRLSMLPAPVAAFLQSVAPAEPGRSNEEG